MWSFHPLKEDYRDFCKNLSITTGWVQGDWESLRLGDTARSPWFWNLPRPSAFLQQGRRGPRFCRRNALTLYWACCRRGEAWLSNTLLQLTGSRCVPPALACAGINQAAFNRAGGFLVLSCLEKDIDSRARQVPDSWSVETARVPSRRPYPLSKLHTFPTCDAIPRQHPKLFLKFLRNPKREKGSIISDMWISWIWSIPLQRDVTIKVLCSAGIFPKIRHLSSQKKNQPSPDGRPFYSTPG